MDGYLWLGHLGRWSDDSPPPFPGPIELYAPTGDGTEDLPPDADHEVEFQGQYADMTEAVRACLDVGRYLWSRPDAGEYLGYMDSRRGSVAVHSY